MPRKTSAFPRRKYCKRVDDALKIVGLTEFVRHDTHKLSGGQKQRVAIAGVLAMLPDCIIFDESTAMLDPRGREGNKCAPWKSSGVKEA